MYLDTLDRQLLELLEANARISPSEIARQLRISRTTVHARLTRLETTGTIQAYTIRLGDELEESRLKAHVMLKHDARLATNITAGLKAIPEVKAILSVSGTYDMIVEISAPSAAKLDALLDFIGSLEGVKQTTSSIILATKLKR